ncbi:hypothetical protein CJU89_3183 [Yarrowia sp. B02]|nr:hypothetical protein CJU89_3183 [Yarrowia sp. B02]
MSDNEKLAAAIRTRLNFAMVKVQKGWEDRSLDQIEAATRDEPKTPSRAPAPRKSTETPARKPHARSDVSAAAIARSAGPSEQKSGGAKSADSSPRVAQASFAVQPHPQAAHTGLGLSIPTSPTPRRRPSKRGHRRATSDILHNSTGGVSGVFKVDKPQERPWQGHPGQQGPYSPQKYHPQLYTQPYSPQQHPYPPPPPPPPPGAPYVPHGSPTVAPSGMVHQTPPHALGQAFQPQPSRQYNYTHAPPYGSSPPQQQYNNNGHFQSHSPTRPSPLHSQQGPPQTPPTSNPTSASGASSARPTLAPLHVSLPPISTSINSPTSAPDRVTLPPMRALYDSPVMGYGDVTSPRAHLPSPAPHSPGQREVDDDAAESLMYFSSPRK